MDVGHDSHLTQPHNRVRNGTHTDATLARDCIENGTTGETGQASVTEPGVDGGQPSDAEMHAVAVAAAMRSVREEIPIEDRRLQLAKSNAKSLEGETREYWHRRKRRPGGFKLGDSFSSLCPCCTVVSPFVQKRVCFPNADQIEIGGVVEYGYDSPRLVPADPWAGGKDSKYPYTTGDNVWSTLRLIGRSPTSAYSENERVRERADHPPPSPQTARQSAAIRSCLKLDTALRAVSWKIEEHVENPTAFPAQSQSSGGGIEISPQDATTICDIKGRADGDAIDAPTALIGTDASLNDGSDDPSEDESAEVGTSSLGQPDTVDGKEYIPEDVVHPSHSYIGDEIYDDELRPSAVSEAYWALANSLHRKAVAKAYRMTLRYPEAYSAWSSLSKKKRGQIRKARKLYQFAVDSGANVNTCTPETAKELFAPDSIERSGIRIGGLVGGVDVEEKGTIAGTVFGDDGAPILLHHRDVHNCAGSTMNLLSASKLTRRGIRCVLDGESAGGSYLLLPEVDGTRRKVPLTYSNGLYLLHVEALYGHGDEDDDENLGLFTFMAAHDARRAPQYEVTTHGTADGHDKSVAYSVAADLQVWHERLGHVSSDAIRLIYRTGSVDDFDIDATSDHAGDCKCTTCMMTKAKKVHMPNRPKEYDPSMERPMGHIVSDVKVIGTPSLTGSKYYVSFIDTCTRHVSVYFLQKKSDVAEAWAQFLAWTVREGYLVKKISIDGGGEFACRKTESGELLVDEDRLAAFEFVCKHNATGRAIECIKTPGANHSDMNPLAERYHRKIMDLANAMLYHARLGIVFWEHAVRHAVFLLNRIPMKFHARYFRSENGVRTAHELITGQKPSYSRIRVWGCDMYERLPNGPKSSEPGAPNARKMIYVGVSSDGKSFVGYDVNAAQTRRDCFNVAFDESMKNRVNNLREYDKRRRLTVDEQPIIFNDWDQDDFDDADHQRSLFDLYPDVTDASSEPSGGLEHPRETVGNDWIPALDSDFFSPARTRITVQPNRDTETRPVTASPLGETDTPQNSSDSTTADLSDRGGGEEESTSDRNISDGHETKSESNVETSDTESDAPDDSESESDFESDGDYNTDDDFSDISEDDYAVPPPKPRKLPRKSKQDKEFPLSFQKSIPKARLHGPLTAARQRELEFKDGIELEPSALIRPPRFEKPGKVEKNRSEELKAADRKFIQAAFDHDYKIIVSKSFQKRKNTASYHRFNMVRPATSVKEYVELSVAYSNPQDHRQTVEAIAKARADFRWEYERGLIKFPDRESDHHAHYCDAERLARRCKVQRVADIISSHSVNLCVFAARSSFNQLIENIYDVQSAIDWIETKERLEAFGRKSIENFMHRSPSDINACLTAAGMEPLDLDPSTHITPTHYHGARKSKDREHWENAMREEISNCNKMETWEYVPQALLPPNAELVDSRWVYKIKSGSDGLITRFRARIVARGFTQRPGVDYNEEEVYAPVVCYDTLRTCMSIAAATDYEPEPDANSAAGSAGAQQHGKGLEIVQADIKNAYLIGHLDKPIYMRQPQSAEMRLDQNGRPMVCKLKRPLYGLKQSGHIFASVLHSFLCDELKMNRLVSDRCAFVKSGDPDSWTSDASNSKDVLDLNGGQLIVLTYVDDLTIIGTKKQTEWIMDKLRGRFSLQESETGDIEFILSMSVKRDRKLGTLTLNQTHAIEKLAKSIGIEVEKPSVVTAMKHIPMTKLEKPESNPEVSNWPYLNMVGSLLHISQCTRPDISYAVGALARHSTTLGAEHVKACKRCIQYLYNTRHLCIRYGGVESKLNEPMVYEAGRSPQSKRDFLQAEELQAYTDADYAMDVPTRKSTSGGIIYLNGGPITWSSKLQPIVAQSTAEAEIIAATHITKEIVHLKLLLSELGVRDDGAVTVHEDNQACILMGNGMKSSRAAKHYEIRLHFLQESIRSGVIKFKYCETNEMIADAFTKPLEPDKFLKFRSLMLFDPNAENISKP